jgi:hypothetical protein
VTGVALPSESTDKIDKRRDADGAKRRDHRMSGAMGAPQTGMNQGKARAGERHEQNTKDAERDRRFGQSGRDQKRSPPFLRMSGMRTGDECEA